MSSRITVIRDAGGIPVAVSALRERRAPTPADDRPDASGAGQDRDDNPFAPPPKGAAVQPWRPRHTLPAVPGEPADSAGPEDARPGGSPGAHDGPAGGDRWSSSQPAPHHAPGQGPFGASGPTGAPGGPDGSGGPTGFGGPGGPGGMLPSGYGPGQAPRPGQGPNGPGGPAGQGGPTGAGPRFDFTDPVQRRARYSLLSGMWALFFGLFGLPQVALLLGAVALYWGISSLRGKAKPPAEQPAQRPDALSAWRSPTAPPPPNGTVSHPPASGSGQHKPQFAAAVSGTIAAALALTIVVATFSFQIAYKGYYDCVNDALTQPGRQACEKLLPPVLRNSLADQG
jgi:hypothetical protein